MRVNLEAKAAIVTGASRGIGRAVAMELAGAGANVLVCARNPEEIGRTAVELNASGVGTVIGIPCDMRRLDQVQRLVGTAIDRFDRIDILVNNAGVGGFAPMGQLSPELWHQVIETNLNGVFYACHEAIPHMIRQQSGWIINIGSLAGKNPIPEGAAYNASKFGLLGFSEAMMLDVRHQGIRVSTIMPGSVATGFSRSANGPSDWKLQAEDVAEMVMDLLAFDSRALPSRVEMRPSRPPRKG